MKRKLMSSMLTLTMAAAVLSGCGGSGSEKPAETAAAAQGESQAAESTGEAEVITFWYNNTGDEAKIYEEAVAAYNASQSKYKVEGLSVTDGQKIIVAMSSDEAPDVIKHGNQTVIQYAKNGLIEPLDEYIAKEGFDTGIYSDQAVAANEMEGELYALPLDAYTIQMYYNKTLLEEAGYSEPPKTMEEMYEMAVKATKVDANGNIEVLGYPLFPYASARQELIYGFGGRWWDENSKPTPNNQGILDSLNMNIKFRNEFGGKELDSFIGTANTNRYTEQDMFFQGKQLFRLDGSWLPTMMKNFNSDVEWGITLVPGTEAHPENRGVSRFETDSIAVTAMSKHKEGAWDFTKFLTGVEGARIIDLGTGNLPAIKALYDDPEILAVPGFAEFIDALKEEKGVQYPQMADYDEYMNLVNAALDTVYAGKQTPEEALNDLADQSAGLE
ncbi:MAG: ABC transporter substrate-binding protein [Lachnospiraceae bacterium]|nr:ABC transporter substrate-binding protein [Lachnospiraceae bacterium]